MPQVDALYTKVKHVIQADNATDPAAWIGVMSKLMQAAQRWRGPGADKKAMVYRVLELVLQNDVPIAHRAAAREIIDGLSHGVDLAVQFHRGRVRLLWCCK